MTSKTIKHKRYYGLIAILAVGLMGGIMYSGQTADADQSTDLSITRNNLIDAAKTDGTPYIKSTPISNTKSLKRGESNLIPVEVTLVSENNKNAMVTLKPVVRGQYLAFDQAIESFSQDQMRSSIESGQLLNGIYDKSEFVSFNVDTITLKANEPQQILVSLSVVDDLSDKYFDNPFRVNVGYELLESNIGDKIPREYEAIEIRSNHAK